MLCYGQWAPYPLSVFSATCCAILSVTATIGNALIVLAVWKDPLKTLHSPFNYFVVNLAVSDLIVGVFSLPIGAYVQTSEALGKLDTISVYAIHMSFFISATASIFSLMALSVDRWIVITYPLKHRSYLTWTRCKIVSVVIAVISLSISWIYIKVGFIEYLMIFSTYRTKLSRTKF